MNIFILDRDHKKCAIYHYDKHVVKMILESAQILCTVLWQSGLSAPYRPTHLRHPCVLWAGESLDNWRWLRKLLFELNKEYRYRFDRTVNHRSYEVIKTLLEPRIKNKGLTPHAQVLPQKYFQKNEVEAYREYYRVEKFHLAKWTKREIPPWFTPKKGYTLSG